MSLKDFKPRYEAKRSFQLDLKVSSDYEKGLTYSVVGAYNRLTDGVQIDAIMQMFLDSRVDKWVNSDSLLKTYQQSYILTNQEKDLGTIELDGALTDLQVERLKTFLMVENREFIASYHDYRPELQQTTPDVFNCRVVLNSIVYKEINNKNVYNVSITLDKLTNWTKRVEYSTLNGNLTPTLPNQIGYDYTYDFPYDADGGTSTTIKVGSIINGGNETAPFILEFRGQLVNPEFWITSNGGDFVGSGKVFGNYQGLRVVTQNVPSDFSETPNQGVYVLIDNVWTETSNYDYSKINFFNLNIGINNIYIQGITNYDIQQLPASVIVYEQYRIVGA